VPPPGQGDELIAEGQVLDHEISPRTHGRAERRQRATRRRSIEPGRILALREIVNGSREDGAMATDIQKGDRLEFETSFRS
jgi:hypothetical protein